MVGCYEYGDGPSGSINGGGGGFQVEFCFGVDEDAWFIVE